MRSCIPKCRPAAPTAKPRGPAPNVAQKRAPLARAGICTHRAQRSSPGTARTARRARRARGPHHIPPAASPRFGRTEWCRTACRVLRRLRRHQRLRLFLQFHQHSVRREPGGGGARQWRVFRSGKPSCRLRASRLRAKRLRASLTTVRVPVPPQPLRGACAPALCCPLTRRNCAAALRANSQHILATRRCRYPCNSHPLRLPRSSATRCARLPRLSRRRRRQRRRRRCRPAAARLFSHSGEPVSGQRAALVA
jgi:hypothetical protein